MLALPEQVLYKHHPHNRQTRQQREILFMNKKATTFKAAWGFTTDNGKLISEHIYLFIKADFPKDSLPSSTLSTYFVFHVHLKVLKSPSCKS